MPRGECALHRQFLALSLAEIARRQARPYTEQSRIILGGLRQTFSGEVYGKRELEPGWCRMKRMHLMELFLLARFARLCECMGKEEEAFLWYDELAAYLCKVPKDHHIKSCLLIYSMLPFHKLKMLQQQHLYLLHKYQVKSHSFLQNRIHIDILRFVQTLLFFRQYI